MDPDKDADGLHPANLGRLALGVDGPVPCTPAGIQALLAHYQVPVEGRHVVIVGRGPTLGRPLAMLLSLKRPGANAAVTVVHTGVPDWADYTRQADIVVGAAGVPNMIGPDDVRPGAAVVGGGISWEGKRLVSDVDESVAEVAGWVTPRLGGVGPDDRRHAPAQRGRRRRPPPGPDHLRPADAGSLVAADLRSPRPRVRAGAWICGHDRGQSGSARDAELGEDVGQVPLDGLLAEIRGARRSDGSSDLVPPGRRALAPAR